MKLILFLILLVNIVFAQQTEVISILNGPIIGNVYDTHKAWLGVPFGQPPVNSMRWKSPVAVSSWSTPYNATYERNACFQFCNLPAGVCPDQNAVAEDCLYLNVFTPNVDFNNLQSPLPVMVFIPGGRFEMGSAFAPLYEGGNIVNSSGVVLVIINYRLGAFGFLQTSSGISANVGFEDQILALQWVQENIKSFGGDPTQVTVFGESAGGTSSSLHLTSPASTGLFSKIIIESNPWSLPIKTIDQAVILGKIFANDLGCDESDINCLYSKSAEDILLAQNKSQNHFSVFQPLLTFLPWTPVVDGKLITDQPLSLIQKGQYNKVPVLLGTVRNEALLFVASITLNINKIEYIGGLIDIFGLKREGEIYSLYSKFINGSNFMDTLGVVGTDYIFVCPTRNAAMYLSSDTSNPVYTYQLQHVTSFNPYGNEYPFCAGAVCHGLELPYLFNNTQWFHFTPEEQVLSTQLMNYWTNFARSGNPNSPNPVNVQWTPYTKANDDMMTLDTPNYMQSGYLNEYCSYWDQLGYEVGW
ncbi:hypothetical protein DICPUDRAFT_34242 [Dictyostelium purpureum]|uniref:Carboxylic ester hydrolase n=1 Tax=Dictyostelium purpureum TaxID=5786 RepID=F0ZMB1_DICPU|nr:uncharacterized protein DICPUDRAFT_34242 [Dictyostelium purpureum]EGC34913.1 hypothetical protein DICPUDRAFT_34242 [Dictyostelium purpureum]|eukprot:XP_003288546.1 hypothetical protein DICPUDRAFT_34242 [Dictyostelium purpureum]